MIKKDLSKPIIPERCKDCEYLCLSYACGLTSPKDRLPIATCKLNHANEIANALRGTYVPCCDVIFLKQVYKCKYDKEKNLLKAIKDLIEYCKELL